MSLADPLRRKQQEGKKTRGMQAANQIRGNLTVEVWPTVMSAGTGACAKGKPEPQAVTAAARELLGFIWTIGSRVEREYATLEAARHEYAHHEAERASTEGFTEGRIPIRRSRPKLGLRGATS